MAGVRTRRVALPIAGGAFVAGVALVLAPLAHAATGLVASFKVTDSWSTGYQGQYTVANPGTSAVTGWRVGVHLPPRARGRNFWAAGVSHRGHHHQVSHLRYHGAVAAGGAPTVRLN